MSGISSVNTSSIQVYQGQQVTAAPPPAPKPASTDDQAGSLGKDGVSTDGRGQESQVELAHIKETSSASAAEAAPPKPKEDGGKGGLFGAIGGFVSDIGGAIGDGLGAIGDGIMGVGEMLVDGANAVVDTVADVAKFSLKATINPFGNLMELAGMDDPFQFLDDLVDEGVDTVADVAKFSNEVVLNPLGTAKDIATDLVGGDDEGE